MTLRGSVIALGVVTFLTGQVGALPIVTGFDVSIYAELPDPTTVTFASDGTAFVGRDWTGSGGGSSDPAHVRRVSAGGVAVNDYGAASILDPDAVLLDPLGTIAPAGSVLVGHGYLPNGQGSIKAILPDESITTILSVVGDVNDMIFDPTGRFLFVTDDGVWTSDGHDQELIVPTSPLDRFFSIAVDQASNIFGGGPIGSVQLYDSSGLLLDSQYAEGFVNPSLCMAPNDSPLSGGLVIADAGALFVVPAASQVVEIGTGFGQVTDVAFGPDGSLYVVEFDQDRILRLTPLVPGDANGDGCVSGADYTIWADNFDDGVGPGGKTWEQGDWTGEGYVTGADFTVWADHYGDGCHPITVPEAPGTLLGGLVFLSVLAARFVRRQSLSALGRHPTC